MFTINETGVFLTIAELYLLFFAKFRSHRVKKRKSYDGNFITAKCSSINDGATLQAWTKLYTKMVKKAAER